MKFSAFARFLLTIILVLAFLSPRAQTPTLASVQTSLQTLSENFPQEKIYVQFDKPTYAAGETVWFKAYIMAGSDPSQISKTVYVDFINPQGKVLEHFVSPILQSGGSGGYEIPLELKDEYVYVKAYTKWMLNFDSSFFYRKTLHIIQPQPAAKRQSTTVKASIQFLPEGGNMVNGIENNVAFKALHFNGTPAFVTGAVFNNKNEKVTDIKTLHDGMGSFALTPQENETYTAKWKDDLGNSYETKLPAAAESGVILKVKVQPNTRSFTVQRSDNAAGEFQKLYIVATMQQHLVYGASVNLSATTVTGGAIPVAELPSGILQITLFDSNWIAIAERITFVNNKEYLFEPEVGFSQLGTDKRKQNVLVIHTPDSITANLSVAVTDEGIGIDSSSDIISGLLMTGDLKGSVYHPYYYFTANTDSLQQQLDLVMLTNGWRRINWDKLVHNKFPEIKYPNEPDYLSLAGKVYGATEQDLKKGAFILLIINNTNDTANRFEQVLVDPSTKGFSNPNIILYDTSKIYYRISGNESFANSSVIDFDNSLSAPKLTTADTATNAFLADTATENYKRKLAEEEMRALRFSRGNTLEDVVVKTRVKSPMQLMDEKYASPLFSSSDAYQFDATNDPFARSAVSVFQYLQGKVAGLTITMAGSASLGGAPSVSWRGGTPAFFLNEIQTDASNLASMNMSDVAYIKVLRPPFVGAVGGGANGAIAVYTRKGGDIVKKEGKGMPFKVVIGYTAQKEFYSPDYGTYNEKNEEKDLRSTLYWAPSVLTTPANNTIRIKFYNNDFSEGFRVVLEGITTDGRLAHIEKVIE